MLEIYSWELFLGWALLLERWMLYTSGLNLKDSFGDKFSWLRTDSSSDDYDPSLMCLSEKMLYFLLCSKFHCSEKSTNRKSFCSVSIYALAPSKNFFSDSKYLSQVFACLTLDSRLSMNLFCLRMCKVKMYILFSSFLRFYPIVDLSCFEMLRLYLV